MEITTEKAQPKLEAKNIDDNYAQVIMDKSDFYYLMDMIHELAELKENCRMHEVQLWTNAAFKTKITGGQHDPFLGSMDHVNQFMRFISEYSTKARRLHDIYGNTDL